ncbi:MAG: hypothetical protein ABW040_08550, partial [Microbacteriaceae bacterium]
MRMWRAGPLRLLGALAALVALVCATAIALLGVLDAAATSGLRSALAAGTASERSLQVELPRAAEGAQAQDAAVSATLRAAFETGRELRIDVARTLAGSEGVRLRAAGGSASGEVEGETAATRMVTASIPALEGESELVAGRWPSGVGEVTLQADAAARVGLEPGAEVVLGDAAVTVVGTWRLAEGGAAPWWGDELLDTGASVRGIGPIVVDEALWPEIGVAPLARWTITPVAATLRGDEVVAVAPVWRSVPDRLADAGIETDGLEQRGGLARTTAQLASDVAALAAVQPLALLALAAVALIALIEFARTLATAREQETLLLWSRGAGAVSSIGGAALGTLAVAVVGAAVGTAIGSGLAFVAVAAVPPAALVIVPSAAIVTTVAAITLAHAQRRRIVTTSRAGSWGGRLARLSGAGAVVAAVAVAGLTTWQLRLYGSPRVGPSVDPLGVLAPAALLIAVVLAAAWVVRLAGAPVERGLARTRGVGSALLLRGIVRRPAVIAVPLVLIGLAAGQVVVAGSYALLWDRQYAAARELANGAELRLTVPGEVVPERLVAGASGVAGVESLAPIGESRPMLG